MRPLSPALPSVAVLVLVLFLLSPSLLAASPAPASAHSSVLAEKPEVASHLHLYRLWVEDQQAYLGQPGVSIGIVRGGELVWAEGFGWADREAGRPASPDTLYRLGSISKTFTATALLRLRDAGRLSLDDPLARYLPALHLGASAASGEGGSEGDAPPITLRHLLTHTSGLPREAPFPYWTDRRFPSLDELIPALEGVRLHFEPGTDYQYSNLGIALAGAVVEVVSGQPFAEALRELVLEPLGMRRTYAATPPAEAELASGYLVRQPEGRHPLGRSPIAPGTEARGLAPAASVSSTVEDLALYLAAHLGQGAHGDFLPVTTRREMQRVHWLSPSWTSGRGLGFSVWHHEGEGGSRTLVGHGGWVAGHRAQIAFEPATDIGVIVLTNSDEGGPASYLEMAFDLVAPALERAAPGETAGLSAKPGVEDPQVDLAALAGAYHNPWGEVSEIFVLDGELVIYDRGRPPSEDPLGSLTRLGPPRLGAPHVATGGDPVFELEGGRRELVFERLPDGRVGRVKYGENYLFPQDCGALDRELRCTWQPEQ